MLNLAGFKLNLTFVSRSNASYRGQTSADVARPVASSYSSGRNTNLSFLSTKVIVALLAGSKLCSFSAVYSPPKPPPMMQMLLGVLESSAFMLLMQLRSLDQSSFEVDCGLLIGNSTKASTTTSDDSAPKIIILFVVNLCYLIYIY